MTNHVGHGSLLIGGKDAGRVNFNLREEPERGLVAVRGTLAGEASLLAHAFDSGLEIQLRRDDTDFIMKIVMTAVLNEGFAEVTVDGPPA